MATLFSLALVIAVLPGSAPPMDGAQLRPGTPAAEVIERLGPPRKVARQVIYKRCLEQWIYEAPHFLRIEIDWVQGRQPQVLRVQPIASPSP